MDWNTKQGGVMAWKEIIQQCSPDLEPFEEIYKDIHQNPELARLEIRTSGKAAKYLKSFGDCPVHENIGGYGVVGLLARTFLCSPTSLYVACPSAFSTYFSCMVAWTNQYEAKRMSEKAILIKSLAIIPRCLHLSFNQQCEQQWMPSLQLL